jgi:hypothetical protein
MERTRKYVGLDVHQATTVILVRERCGRVIFRGVLVEFFRGMGGAPSPRVARPPRPCDPRTGLLPRPD